MHTNYYLATFSLTNGVVAAFAYSEPKSLYFLIFWFSLAGIILAIQLAAEQIVKAIDSKGR